MALVNFWRTPSTTRRSFTRGAVIITGPTPVSTGRGRARPLRTTSACPAAFRSSRYRARYSSTSISRAAAIIRCAPVRARSSSVVPSDSSPLCSVFAVISSSTGGVPFSPGGTGVLGVAAHNSPEGYVASLAHPQLLTIAREGRLVPVLPGSEKDRQNLSLPGNDFMLIAAGVGIDLKANPLAAHRAPPDAFADPDLQPRGIRGAGARASGRPRRACIQHGA